MNTVWLVRSIPNGRGQIYEKCGKIVKKGGRGLNDTIDVAMRRKRKPVGGADSQPGGRL